MPTTVNIPEVGTVNFPDSMSAEEVKAQSAKLYQNASQGSDQSAAESPQSSAAGAFGRAAATGVAPAAAGAGGFWAGATAIAPVAAASGPFAPLVELAGGAIGAGVSAYGASKAQQAIIHKAAPQFEQQQAVDVQQHPVASAAGRIASALPTFELNPGQSIRGLAAIPAVIKGTASAAQRKALAATAIQAGTQGGLTAAQTGLSEGRLPSKGELAEAGISALLYGNPRIKALMPRSVAAAQAATGVKPNAIPVRSAEALPVGQTPRGSEEVGQGVSQPEAPTQAQAQEAQPVQPPVRLTPDEQSYLDNERQSIDVPVQVVEGPLTGNHPFARRQADIATIDRANNQVLINAAEFGNWLSHVPAKLKALAVRSLFSEERIHLGVSDEDALAYANSLTWLEKRLGQRIYNDKWQQNPLSDTALGHEMLRYRLQQFARMTPREVVEASGREKWTVQSLSALNTVVRTIRETLGTKASKEGLAILDRVQGNLGTALAVARGDTTPAALNKRAKAAPEEREASLYLPPMEKGAPRPASEELGVSGYVTKRTLDARDIAFDEARGTGFRPITPSEAKSPSELSEILTQDARMGGSSRLESETHRLTALYDRYTGRVDVVSTYPHQRRGAMLADPHIMAETGAGAERPHQPLGSILRRYTPIYSIYRREPVKGFHERYESMADFQKEFGIPAKQLASSSVAEIGGAGGRMARTVKPEESTQSITIAQERDQPFDLRTETPAEQAPSEADLRVLHRSLAPEQLPRSADALLEQLARKGATLPRQAVGAITQMMEREMARDLDISPDTALDRAIANLYEDLKTSGKDRTDFTRRALGRFAPEASGENLGREIQPEQVVGTPSETKRVLTMPIERRAPTDVRPENVPPGAIPARQPATPSSQVIPGAGQLSAADQAVLTQRLREKYPRAQAFETESGAVARLRRESKRQADIEATRESQKFELFKPPVPDGGIPGASSAPAAINKHFREAQDVVFSEADRVYSGVKTMFTRKDVKDIANATFDSVNNIGNNIGVTADVGMRIASGGKRPPIFSSAKTFWEWATNTGDRFGRKQVLRSAMALADAHAVQGTYSLKSLHPDARKLFLETIKSDPRYETARKMIASPSQQAKSDGYRMLREANASAWGRLINAGYMKASSGTYDFLEQGRDSIPGLMQQIQKGINRAQDSLSTRTATFADARSRRRARQEINKFTGMLKDYQWAYDHWNDPDLRATALQARKRLDFQYDRESQNGIKLRYDPNHTPGRYEGEEYNDGTIFFPEQNVLGTKFRQAKTFGSYAEAASNGYIPATQDMASIIGHRVRAGERKIERGLWQQSLFNLTDEQTGLPMVQKLVKKDDGSPSVPSQDYAELDLGPGYDKVAVLKPYESLLKSLVGESKVVEFAPARIALELAQRLKHTILIGDFFHLGRLTYYAQSIAGVRKLAGHKGGLAALDFAESDIPKAVEAGFISQKAADWALGKVTVRQGTKSFEVTRRQIANNFQRRGLNVGQIQDALYKDLVGDMPFFGRWNRWLFDSYTRGLMMESAVSEFERLNAKHPNIDSGVLIRDIARDTNRMFGNLGSQGWFKSKTWRDAMRLGFLAPQWVEGLVMKEVTAPLRLAGADIGQTGLIPHARGDLPRLGTLGKGIAGGFATMMLVTQAINLLTRGKPTWMNEEDGHKWDAYIRGGKNGFFLSPLSVFNELTHDLVRLWETKPKAWDAVAQIGQNKLSPFGRALLVLHDSKSPTGEYQTKSVGVLKTAAEQLAPTPIGFGKLFREAGHTIAPGQVAPNQPGAFQRQAMQWLGLKAEPGASASQRMSRLAQQFVAERGGAQSGYRFEPTDDPSYAKLRSAIRAGDTAGATKVLNQLREGGRTEQQIGKVMKMWNQRPFTGSKKAEREFMTNLSEPQRALYWQAQEERQQTYESFLNLLLNSGR